MPKVKCSECGAILQVRDDKIGQSGKCPKCQAGFVLNAIPEPPPPRKEQISAENIGPEESYSAMHPELNSPSPDKIGRYLDQISNVVFALAVLSLLGSIGCAVIGLLMLFNKIEGAGVLFTLAVSLAATAISCSVSVAIFRIEKQIRTNRGIAENNQSFS